MASTYSKKSVNDRLRDGMRIDAATGCWVWQRGKTAAGYGQIGYLGRVEYAHRLCYEMFRAPIDPELEIDHLCGNRGCINPDHLEPVTHRVNILRGNAPSARHAKKTHCPKGHPYDVLDCGQRRCRACRNERRNARYAILRGGHVR